MSEYHAFNGRRRGEWRSLVVVGEMADRLREGSCFLESWTIVSACEVLLIHVEVVGGASWMKDARVRRWAYL